LAASFSPAFFGSVALKLKFLRRLPEFRPSDCWLAIARSQLRARVSLGLMPTPIQACPAVSKAISAPFGEIQPFCASPSTSL
jgi:hypothetical protein